MFWGMTLEPGKLYTETMGEEVQLSMAAIDSRKDLGESPSTNFCQIVIQTEKGEYVLCTLVHGVMFQQSLDLKLMPREKVTFSVQGPSVVYLVGYTASYPEDEEEMRLHREGYEEDSSAWETFVGGEQENDQVKQETVKREGLMGDSDLDVETQEQIAADSLEHIEGAATEEAANDSGDEIIFSVAEIDQQPMVKTEPPDPDSGPPDTPEVMTPSQQQQQPPPQEDIDRTRPSDHRISQPHTSTSQDFFHRELKHQQEQADDQLTPPVAFQPINSSPAFRGQNPPGGVLPLAEALLHTLQSSHAAGPVRQSVPRDPTKRTYPTPRQQYGTNPTQPAAKKRSTVQTTIFQQMRTVRKIEEQQLWMLGASQTDVPGQSDSRTGEPATSEVSTSNPERAGSAVTEVNNSKKQPHGAEERSTESHPTKAAANDASVSQDKTREGEACSDGSASKNLLPSPLFCRHCGKMFTDRIKYRSHEYQHTRERRFHCSFCHKSFRSSEHRINHERVHTGERPFMCRFCDKSFTRKYTCRKHEKKHSAETECGSVPAMPDGSVPAMPDQP